MTLSDAIRVDRTCRDLREGRMSGLVYSASVPCARARRPSNGSNMTAAQIAPSNFLCLKQKAANLLCCFSWWKNEAGSCSSAAMSPFSIGRQTTQSAARHMLALGLPTSLAFGGRLNTRDAVRRK